MTIYIKRNDTKGKFVDILTINGIPINLTACIVSFLLRKGSSVSVKQLATITDPVSGAVEYQPLPEDVATAGEFQQEWEIIFPDTQILTVPNNTWNIVNILKDLG